MWKVVCISVVCILVGNTWIADKARAATRCAAEIGLKSGTGGRARNVNFVNKTVRLRKVYWLNRFGRRDLDSGSGGLLDPGNRLRLRPTYVGHWFVVTDKNDNCVGVYGIGSDTRTIFITK